MPKQIVQIPLQWIKINWHPDDTWERVTLPKLLKAGIRENLIDRTVYAIRIRGDFAIDYPAGQSPTVYIGEGNFGSRITSHRKWACELNKLVGESNFEVCVATPRVRRNPNAYLDCEAALLLRFGDIFHSAPLWNKQFEKRKFEHYFYETSELDHVLRKRMGTKFKWAIKPMRSSLFFEHFHRTHLA